VDIGRLASGSPCAAGTHGQFAARRSFIRHLKTGSPVETRGRQDLGLGPSCSRLCQFCVYKSMRIILIAAAAMIISPSARASECRTVPRDDARWEALDRRYAIIEAGTFNRDPKLLFSVYSPDFEAHQFNGEVWTFIYHQLRSFPSSASEKKSLYVRALSVLCPSLLTSKNSDGLRLFVAPPLANQAVKQEAGQPCQV